MSADTKNSTSQTSSNVRGLKDTFGKWAQADPILLSDEQMQKFIVEGYVQVNTGLSKEELEHLYERMSTLLYDPEQSPSKGDNPNDNVLTMLPEFRRVTEAPAFRGALTSILGPGYVEHAHKRIHDLQPKHMGGAQAPQAWHKDQLTPTAMPPHHHPHWVMVLFYCQDTPKIMGPTDIMPGTQYDPLTEYMSDDSRNLRLQAAGKAGTITIVHFDIVHRGPINLHKSTTRFMIKLNYRRTASPVATGPSWNIKSAVFQVPKTLPFCNALPLWVNTWEWLQGKNGFASLESAMKEYKGSTPPDDISELVEALDRSHEETKTGSDTPNSYAYWLAANFGQKGIQALLEALQNSQPHPRWHFNDIYTQLHPTAYALGANGGEEAVTIILKALREEIKFVKEQKMHEDKTGQRYTGSFFVMEPEDGDDESSSVRIREVGTSRYMDIEMAEEKPDWEGCRGFLYLTNRSKGCLFEMPDADDMDAHGNPVFFIKDGEAAAHLDGLGDQRIRLLDGFDDEYTKFARVDTQENGSFRLRCFGSGHCLEASSQSGDHVPVKGAPYEMSEWRRTNIAFALGELGADAAAALPDLLTLARMESLRDTMFESQRKAMRVLVEAIGDIASSTAHKNGRKEQHGRKILSEAANVLGEVFLRTPDDELAIRISAIVALLKMGTFAAPVESVLIKALTDDFVMVQWYAAQALVRIGTPTALRAAVHMMIGRWAQV